MVIALTSTVVQLTLALSRLPSSSTQLLGFAFDGDADRVPVDDQGRRMGLHPLPLGSDLKSGTTTAWKLNCIHCNG